MGECAEILRSTMRSVRRGLEENPGRIQSGRLADRLALWEKLSLGRRLKTKSWSWAWRRSCWRSVCIYGGLGGKTFFLPVVSHANELPCRCVEFPSAEAHRGQIEPSHTWSVLWRTLLRRTSSWWQTTWQTKSTTVSQWVLSQMPQFCSLKCRNTVSKNKTYQPEPLTNLSRVPPATSAVRRLWTPRRVAEAKTAEGSRGSSVDRAWGTDTERMSGRRLLIRSDDWNPNTHTDFNFGVFILEQESTFPAADRFPSVNVKVQQRSGSLITLWILHHLLILV